MKRDKFLCFMFLFAFLALTLHKTRQKHAFFGRITNQKLRLTYSKLTCEPKTKDCPGSRSLQHLIATVLFLLLKFPGFHNHSPILTMVKKEEKYSCYTCSTYFRALLCRTPQSNNLKSPNFRFWQHREHITINDSFSISTSKPFALHLVKG